VSWQAAVLVGVLLRLLLFLGDESLWRDEAKLLMGLNAVSTEKLFNELPFGQRAPFALGLLWKGMIENSVGRTRLIRLPSLAAGIAQLFVFTFLVKSIFKHNNKQSNIVIWIIAVSPRLILFSAQVKPYIFDVFFSTVLTALALPFFLKELQQSKQSVILVSVSWISLVISYPASFIVGGICLGLLFKYGFRRIRLLLTISLGALIIIIFIYSASGDSSEYMQNWWKGYYPTPSIRWWINALFQSVFQGLTSPTYLTLKRSFLLFGWLFFPLCALGAINLWRMKKSGLLCLLLFPSFLCLVASLLHKYPYGDRVILFMMPQVIVLLGLGLVYLSSSLNGYKFIAVDYSQQEERIVAALSNEKLERIAQWGLWATVILCCSISIIEYSFPCKGIKFGLDYIAQRERQRDIIIVDEYASQVVKYYQTLDKKETDKKFPEAELVFPWPDETKKEWRPTAQEVVDSLPSKSRIWIIAESTDIHRSLTSSNLASVTEMINALMDSRKKLHELKVPRLLVVCFSDEY
jgi:hypothetical protein